MLSLKTCGECAIYIPEAKSCQFMPSLPGQFEPTDYCSKHIAKNDLIYCDYCGQATLEPIIEYNGAKLQVMCHNCYVNTR